MSENHLGNSVATMAHRGVATHAVRFEMTIDSAVSNVWRHMINYTEWNPDHIGARVERIAGEKNQQGEVILEYKKADVGYAAPGVIETVTLIPNERIVWALYGPDMGPANGIWFVDFSLQDADGKTLFTYNLYGWMKTVEDGRKSEKAGFQASVLESLQRILPALKAYVENC